MAEDVIDIKLSEVKDGLVRIAIAYTGDQYKQGKQTFTISESDLDSMAAHMADRETPIDYEHMSAGVTPPGWSKAAGWIAAKAGSVEDFGDGRKVLWGWFEPTPACLSAIRSKEYRYFSPEIHWNDKDEKGNAIGTRLRAGAITNRPFLKDLPPIEVAAADYPQLLDAVALSESRRLTDSSAVHIDKALKEKTMAVKQLKFKKLTDGENKGKIGAFADDEMVGMCDKAAMKAYMMENSDEGDEMDDDPVAKAKATEVACFSEIAAAKTGTDAQALVEKFVEDGKFDTRALMRAQKVERLIAGAIAAGKLLPKQRTAMFHLASSNYDHAVALLTDARPVVDLTTRGIAVEGETTVNESAEQERDVVAYMTEKKVDRIAAYREVTRRNPGRYERVKNQGTVVTGTDARD